jgi:hypothetical protein
LHSQAETQSVDNREGNDQRRYIYLSKHELLVRAKDSIFSYSADRIHKICHFYHGGLQVSTDAVVTFRYRDFLDSASIQPFRPKQLDAIKARNSLESFTLKQWLDRGCIKRRVVILVDFL